MALPETTLHRRQQLALRAVLLKEWLSLWPALDPARLDESFPSWALQAAQLIVARHKMSSALAADYLRSVRDAAGLTDEATIVFAPSPVPEQVVTSLRVTSIVAAKKAVGSGMPIAKALVDAYVQSAGAASRLVLDGSRDTIRQSLAADPRADGWRRVTSGKGCDFCRMLAGRGEVYKASTATFASHDHCGCTAEPVYGGGVSVREFSPTQRRTAEATREANNARVRAFIRAGN